jgi:hypothetical protein
MAIHRIGNYYFQDDDSLLNFRTAVDRSHEARRKARAGGRDDSPFAPIENALVQNSLDPKKNIFLGLGYNRRHPPVI